MTNVINFQDAGLASLRQRVAALDEANQDLIAFARGHSGAASSIHAAVIAAMDAEGLEHLVHCVTQDWTDILGVDAVAIALVAGDRGLRAGGSGLQFVSRAEIASTLDGVPEVLMRGVPLGDPVFGPAAPLIRAEALIRLDMARPLPEGVLALGSRQAHAFDGGHGSELLAFLGRATARMIARWLMD